MTHGGGTNNEDVPAIAESIRRDALNVATAGPGQAQVPEVGSSNGRTRRGPYTRWTPELRQEIIKFAEERGVKAAENAYNVHRKQISDWRRRYAHEEERVVRAAAAIGQEEVRNVHVDVGIALRDRRKEASGNFHVSHEFEDLVHTELQRVQQVCGQAVKRHTIQSVGKRIAEESGPPHEGFKASEKWARGFLSRKGYSWRRVTTGGRQQIVNPEKKDALHKLYVARVARVASQFVKYPALVVHADEMCLNLLDNDAYTYAPRGTRSVSTRHHGEKVCVTVMLSGDLDGTLFEPFLIFKGHTARVIPSDLPAGVMAHYSPTAWMNLECAKTWIESVVIPRTREAKRLNHLPEDHPILLTWDHFGVHKCEDLLSWMKSNFPFIRMVMVPPRATSFLQLEDIAVNAGFKSEFGRAYRTFFHDLAARHQDQHGYDLAEKEALSAANLRQRACDWTARAIAHVRGTKSLEKGIRRIGLDQWDSYARLAEELGDDLWQRDESMPSDVTFVDGDLSRARRRTPASEAVPSRRPRQRRNHGGKVGHKKSCGVCGGRGHNKRTCPKRTTIVSRDSEPEESRERDPQALSSAEEGEVMELSGDSDHADGTDWDSDAEEPPAKRARPQKDHI